MAIAEETGLIVDLGARVFAGAVAFAQRWPALRVAVPVSAVQLRHLDFVAETVRVFRAAGLGPERMELAVKQVALADAVHPMAVRLAALRSAGLGIALVDFDAGYSALRHVHRFAVDRVAIDPCFVPAEEAVLAEGLPGARLVAV